MSRSVCWVSLAVFLAPATLIAAEYGIDARMQMNTGGESLASVTYSDGSESALKLGTYFAFSVGGVFVPLSWDNGSALELEANVGWGSWSTGPENTEDRLSLARVPLELLGFYRLALPAEEPMHVRFGGGLTYHLIGSASGSGALEGTKVEVDNALGWVVETAFVYDIFAAGLRYTAMTYNVGAADVGMSASSVGVFAAVYFGTFTG